MRKLYIFLFTVFLIFSASEISYSQDIADDVQGHGIVVLQSDVLIYPNPVTENKFYVKSDKLIKKVEVINILGQKIKTVNNQTGIPYNIIVETSDMRKGMYMVQVTLETGEKIINKILIK